MQVETAGQCPGRRTGQGWDGQVGWHHACYGLTHLTLVTTRTRVRKAAPTVSYTRSCYMGRAHRPVHIGARLPPTGILGGISGQPPSRNPSWGKKEGKEVGREEKGEGERKRGRQGGRDGRRDDYWGCLESFTLTSAWRGVGCELSSLGQHSRYKGPTVVLCPTAENIKIWSRTTLLKFLPRKRHKQWLLFS